jgi:hypothetical protein
MIILPSKTKKIIFRWGALLIFFLINNKVTVMPLEENKKYTCIKRHLFLFLFLNSKMREFLWLEKTKAICEGILVFFN